MSLGLLLAGPTLTHLLALSLSFETVSALIELMTDSSTATERTYGYIRLGQPQALEKSLITLTRSFYLNFSCEEVSIYLMTLFWVFS
jgi:hypothetical protein